MKANSKCKQLIVSLLILIGNSEFQIQGLHFFRGYRKFYPFICKDKVLCLTIIIPYRMFLGCFIVTCDRTLVPIIVQRPENLAR
uniref:Uncharacterized protein n=1 Tax=Arundo donax TaxID=35708 RepID=A0A0A9G360_ARUDO